jgi:4-hydroxybenzoate polyprenyltransferase
MKVTWPQALVIAVALLALAVLAFFKVDTTAIMTVILVIMSGFGYTSLKSISDKQDETNETVTGLHERLDTLEK